MRPRVSVIVPVYKVEQYIERCVESIRRQTVEDIEIILVDDGSPDECPRICDEYTKKDERIRVIHKQNGGLASARNAGMRVSKGEYTLFVDSDDWIDENTLEELTEIADKYAVDWVRFRPMCAGWPNRKDGELCDFGAERGMKEGLYDKEMIEAEIYPRLFATPQLTLGVIVAAWRSLYRTDFLKNNRLYFYDEVRYSEDTIFSANVVMATERFYYLDGGRYYHYFFNPASITKSFKADRWDSCKKLIACFERDFRNREEYDFTEQLCLQKIHCVVSALSQKELIPDIRERREYCREICNDTVSREALKHVGLVKSSFKMKIMLMILRSNIIGLIARI